MKRVIWFTVGLIIATGGIGIGTALHIRNINMVKFREAEKLLSQSKYMDAWEKLKRCKEFWVGKKNIEKLKRKIVRAMLEDAKTLLKDKKWQEAEKLAKEVLLIDPDNKEANEIINKIEK